MKNRSYLNPSVCRFIAVLAFAFPLPGFAQTLGLPGQFGPGAVLQRDMSLSLWGWAEPGMDLSVKVAGVEAKTKVDEAGSWRISLPPLEPGGPFSLVVACGDDRLEHTVWVGEVWMAGGQSNMRWPISQSRNADLFQLTEENEAIRFLRIEVPGQQIPQKDFPGEWQPVDRQTIGDHSAVAFHFAKLLHQVLDVPIGIIDNSWGGSAAEGWIDRRVLANHPELSVLHEGWLPFEAAQEKLEEPSQQMIHHHRPGNVFYTRVHPLIPMAFRGVIWYQGENNAGRAKQYRSLFPLLIESWRDAWDLGDFPFYWVQLAAYREAGPSGPDNYWSELREAQYLTQRLPNTGQAVAIDMGDGTDIHPWEKEEVGRRLARWALARDYGLTNLNHQSPEIEAWRQEDTRLIVDIAHAGSGMRLIEYPNVKGFAVAGKDREWIQVTGVLNDSGQVVLELPEDMDVRAVRYAWASNPVVNLYSREGLPLTPYRSDDWPLLGDENQLPPGIAP